MKLSGQAAIVTGSARGIGKAIAVDLAKEGCNIVINSRTKREVEATAKEIKKLGVEILPVVADISNEKEVARRRLQARDGSNKKLFMVKL